MNRNNYYLPIKLKNKYVMIKSRDKKKVSFLPRLVSLLRIERKFGMRI